MEEQKVILVTWDFTEKSEFAFEHAYQVAKVLRCGISLLHIAKKESETKSLEERIHGIISDKYSDRDIKPTALIRCGNIFTTIGEAAEEVAARMVIMGTHGIKGSQKFFGSWALKVIANTKVPFVVVQGKPDTNRNLFKDVVFPVNYRKENKESVNWLQFMSKNFGVKIHLFLAKHTDQKLSKGLESNMLFLTKHFKQKAISFELVEAAGEDDFVKEVVDYSQKVEANAIFVMTTKDIGLTDYMMGAHEQYIIANNFQIPVICVNPKPPKFGGSFSTSAG